MAGKFVTTGLHAAGNSNATAVSVIGAATVVGLINEFTFSTFGTPGDGIMEYIVARASADGTGTTVTPAFKSYSAGIVTPIGPLCTSKSNYSGEPTPISNSSLWDQGVNQRATFRWYVGPGDEIMVPAIAAHVIRFMGNNGNLSPVYQGNFYVSVSWSE